MLKVLPININKYNTSQRTSSPSHKNSFSNKQESTNINYPIITNRINFSNINFKARIVKDIEHQEYIEMPEKEKEEIREKYLNFYKLVDFNDLYTTRNYSRYSMMPLVNERAMDDFLRLSKEYNKYRDNKIICVGRSPKWFLNASIWMKDGIKDYDFIAFSSNWYKRDCRGMGLQQTYKEENYPTPENAKAYKDYLKRMNCSPKDIIEAAKDGKQVIITDYIHSGCGLASFLDILSKFAEEEGVLEDFAKSIRIFTLSSLEYLDDLDYELFTYFPKVILPDRLKPFNVEQEYHDMSANVMREMLINKNTNECRSTYYPPAAWTIYDPTDFKTGLIQDKDLKNIPEIMKRTNVRFTDGMKDYRNLMNFRILDALNKRNLLKLKHITK